MKREIRYKFVKHMHDNKYSLREIAEVFNTSHQQIKNILERKGRKIQVDTINLK